MLVKTKKIIKDIKTLKIQGATNISQSAREAVLIELENCKQKDTKPSRDYFTNIFKEMWMARSTEPAMKDFLVRFTYEFDVLGWTKNNLNKMINFTKEDINSQKKYVEDVVDNLILELGLRKYIVVTHCHSSIVERTISKMHEKGLLEYVVNSETRPRYQGRITALNIADNKIRVKHLVDSGIYGYVQNLLNEHPTRNIIFLTGADVVTKRGDLVNKIGTSQISLGMKDLGIKHFVLTTSAKIDLVDRGWNLDKVEMRDKSEIWDTDNKFIDILNYAFDVTPYKNIYKIVTERGAHKVSRLLRFRKVDRKYFSIWREFDR